MAGDEDGFSGIDPDQLAKTIQSLQKDQEKLKSSATWIKSSFERYGVETDPLTELLAIAGWSENQLPMLRRRHHLSIAEDEKYGHGYKGMVRIKESMVGQTKQSVANGKKLGDEFKEKLENGEDITPEMFADLRANKADADYVKSFYDVLGSRNLLWMSQEMGDRNSDVYKDDAAQREKDRKTIADTFGTYTKVAFEGKTSKEKQRAWNKWFDDSAVDEHFGFRPDRLTPLLRGGSHDKDFLVAFGDRVFQKDAKTNENQFLGNSGIGEGEWGKDGYEQLFDAISRNSEASGEWMDHNADGVQSMLYTTGPWKVDEPKERGVAFLNILQAGSVTLRKGNPALAEKNAARLIYENYQHSKGDMKGVHPIDGTSALYTSIMTSYWKDVEHSVTSPVSNDLWSGGKAWTDKSYFAGQDKKRAGLELSQEMWGALTVEAGRDPKGAGIIGALFQGYNQKMIAQENDINQDRTGDSVRYISAQKGMMQRFYYENMRTVGEQLGAERDKWVEDTNAFRDSLIDQVTGVAMGATGGAGMAGAKGAAIGAAYGMGSDILTGWIKEGVHVAAADAPAELRHQIAGVKKATIDTSWQTSYQDQANDLLREKNGGFDARYIPEVEVWKVDGSHETYTGNPKEYIKGDSSRNFLTKDGVVMDPGKMSPTQRTAYGEWLRDPAVVQKVYTPFSDGRNSWDWPGQNG
ncbi:hypothetical protein ACIRL0_20150 [Streptomyces sp. NPDC102365]|uniref:hypothetical protein n=1 Tax=Streptomyces sp. NPDC102365 TaxID=3366162 RepID=UPI00380353DE